MEMDADPFSPSYADARAKFLQAAQHAALPVTSYRLALPGRNGEALAVDAAWQGPRDARRLLLLSSGVHGVEGFCGSGAQTALLRDGEWMARAGASGEAVLYLHALNPHGFSHLRRVTQENVDLNRNFQDFSRPLPANPAYGRLHPLLLPAQWPPTWRNRAAIFGLIATQGLRRLQTAISSGQHEHADGLFFGGTEPTWSQLTLRRVLREHGSRAGELVWIDLHTGLGRSGRCERVFMGTRDEDAAYARANAFWGARTALTHVGTAASVSASVAGLVWNAALQECAQAQFTGMYMEFGTRPLLEVMHALRGDHWLHLHPQAPPALAAEIGKRMFEAFFVDTPAWKQAVLTEVREAALQVLAAWHD
jgi:hypothetical protein